MAKAGEQQNKVVLDYDPKYKINIHEPIPALRNELINKWGRETISHAEEFPIIYVEDPQGDGAELPST